MCVGFLWQMAIVEHKPDVEILDFGFSFLHPLNESAFHTAPRIQEHIFSDKLDFLLSSPVCSMLFSGEPKTGIQEKLV